MSLPPDPSGAGGPPMFAVKGQYVLDGTETAEVSLQDLYLAQQLLGRHCWVIGVLHRLEDPEQALDAMNLGQHNLIGFERIRCLFCEQPYPNDGSGVALAATPCPGPSWVGR